MGRSYVAVDLGAGSGRVILATIGDANLELEVLHRFANGPRLADGHLRWNVQALLEGITEGLTHLPDRGCDLRSLGVDTWGVDYGLLDEGGSLIEDPIAYRDARTDGIPETVFEAIPREELFAATGLQVQPFNTLYQLYAPRAPGLVARTHSASADDARRVPPLVVRLDRERVHRRLDQPAAERRRRHVERGSVQTPSPTSRCHARAGPARDHLG